MTTADGLVPMAHALTPVGLKCRYQENPVGVDVAQPRLTWVYPFGRLDAARLDAECVSDPVATSLAHTDLGQG